jgi:hypothetical protein
MACCGAQGSGEAERTLPFPLALILLSGSAVLSLVALVGLGAVSPFSREARASFLPLAGGARAFLAASGNRMLAQPFLVSGPDRCRITGRLYPISETLAGMLYRYFNLFVLGFLGLAIAGIVLGLRHLAG